MASQYELLQLLIIFFTMMVIPSVASNAATYEPREFPGYADGGECQGDMDSVLHETYRVIQNEIEQLSVLAPATTTNQVPQTYTCGGTPGWRQVAFVNMSDISSDCPPGLVLGNYSKRTCVPPRTLLAGCYSTTIGVGDTQYSRVCGRIIGYTYYANCAFHEYLAGPQKTIDGWYLDGVSLTHGVAGQRQHIWTFAGGSSDIHDNGSNNNCFCPCTSNPSVSSPPFVGNDYFCESGLNTPYARQRAFYPDDPLWDGENCPSGSTCCQLNNPPWFTKNLPNPTTDDIILRMCSRGFGFSVTPIELIELYVSN